MNILLLIHPNCAIDNWHSARDIDRLESYYNDTIRYIEKFNGIVLIHIIDPAHVRFAKVPTDAADIENIKLHDNFIDTLEQLDKNKVIISKEKELGSTFGNIFDELLLKYEPKKVVLAGGYYSDCFRTTFNMLKKQYGTYLDSIGTKIYKMPSLIFLPHSNIRLNEPSEEHHFDDIKYQSGQIDMHGQERPPGPNPSHGRYWKGEMKWEGMPEGEDLPIDESIRKIAKFITEDPDINPIGPTVDINGVPHSLEDLDSTYATIEEWDGSLSRIMLKVHHAPDGSVDEGKMYIVYPDDVTHIMAVTDVVAMIKGLHGKSDTDINVIDWSDIPENIIRLAKLITEDPDVSNENKPILYMPIGPSGIGKSTLFNKLKRQDPNIEVFSWDILRHKWYDPKDYNVAFKKSTEDLQFRDKANAEFIELLKTKRNIYVDNTNLTPRVRSFYIKMAKDAGYDTAAVVFPKVEPEELIARQMTRTDKRVPEDAVRQQLLSMMPPEEEEFDYIMNA